MALRPGGGFITPLVVESIDPVYWKLADDLCWIGSQGDKLFVPAGEITDFASVPTLLQSFAGRTGAWTKAAVVHDMLCTRLNEYWAEPARYVYRHADGVRPKFNAVDTDNIFEKIMLEDGVGETRAALMWAAVRWGAAMNPARRRDWWSTFPRLALITTTILVIVLFVLAVLAVLGSLVVPW